MQHLIHTPFDGCATRRLFSQDDLNTREVKGQIDRTSLETELKVLFEDDFPKHLFLIQNFIATQENKQETYEAMCLLMILGVLGELRNPEYKKYLDDTMIDFQSEIFSRMHPFSKEQIKVYVSSRKKVTPYNNTISYLSIAFKILEKMEPFDFMIYSIESNDHFLLPDTSSFQLRGQLQHHRNPMIREIIQIGVPITDKIYVLATPQAFKTDLHAIHWIKEDQSEMVDAINLDLFLFAKKAIACKDNDYLKGFVSRVINKTL